MWKRSQNIVSSQASLVRSLPLLTLQPLTKRNASNVQPLPRNQTQPPRIKPLTGQFKPLPAYISKEADPVIVFKNLRALKDDAMVKHYTNCLDKSFFEQLDVACVVDVLNKCQRVYGIHEHALVVDMVQKTVVLAKETRMELNEAFHAAVIECLGRFSGLEDVKKYLESWRAEVEGEFPNWTDMKGDGANVQSSDSSLKNNATQKHSNSVNTSSQPTSNTPFKWTPKIAEATIKVFFRHGNYGVATKLFHQLRQHFAPTVPTVNAMIKGLGELGYAQKAKDIYDLSVEMDKERGVLTAPSTHCAMLHAYANRKDMVKANQLFKNLLQTDYQDFLKTNPHLWIALLRGYCLSGQQQEAESILRYMQQHHLTLTPRACEYVMTLYARCGNLAKVIHYFYLLEGQPDFKPTLSMWMVLMQSYVLCQDVLSAWKVLAKITQEFQDDVSVMKALFHTPGLSYADSLSFLAAAPNTKVFSEYFEEKSTSKVSAQRYIAYRLNTSQTSTTHMNALIQLARHHMDKHPDYLKDLIKYAGFPSVDLAFALMMRALLSSGMPVDIEACIYLYQQWQSPTFKSYHTVNTLTDLYAMEAYALQGQSTQVLHLSTLLPEYPQLTATSLLKISSPKKMDSILGSVAPSMDMVEAILTSKPWQNEVHKPEFKSLVAQMVREKVAVKRHREAKNLAGKLKLDWFCVTSL